MKRKLSETDRRSFVEKFMEWGNWVFGVVVLGHIVTEFGKGINWLLIVLGALFWILAYWVAYIILRR